jgi:hypothetical protein
MDESYSPLSVDVKWVCEGAKRSGILIFDADPKSSEELSILCCQLEDGFLAQVGIEFLAVNKISFTPLVEPDGHFQNEEKIVSRSANAR